MTEQPDDELRYTPATGSVAIPDSWSPLADRVSPPPPARCGSTAAHPPHPIDGSAPGVPDCEGMIRRATEAEIAQARAWADHCTADWEFTAPDFESAKQGEYEHALEILIHANGGRYAEPAPEALLAARLRDADGDVEALQELRAQDATRIAELEALHRFAWPVIGAAIGWRKTIAAGLDELSTEEQTLAGAVDAHLAARGFDGEARESGALSPPEPERAPSVPTSTPDGREGYSVPPVTPAAELADEAAHERVARAVRPVLANLANAPELAHRIAGVAIAAYRAGPTNDVGQRAVRLMEQLHAGLTDRGLGYDAGMPHEDVATRILSTIDAFQTALDEAARDAHEAVELQAVHDSGLSTDQEIRARALDAAVAMDEIGANTDAILDDAAAFAAWITDGDTRDTRDTGDGVILDEPWEVTNGQRRYCEGYAEAVRRLRDEDAYRSWWTARDYPPEQQYWRAEARGHLADYLETLAPDPDDPWADAAPEEVRLPSMGRVVGTAAIRVNRDAAPAEQSITLDVTGAPAQQGGSVAYNGTDEPEIVVREPGGADGC